MGCNCGGKNRLAGNNTDRTSTRTTGSKTLHRPSGDTKNTDDKK